jgi:acetylornithine/succinyldiaminopimelate/putrescine aminotransferase
LGEGGYHVAPDVFLLRLGELCSRRSILLTVDKVQNRMGRIGRLFAWQHMDLVPEVMALAKALGSRFPIGAVLSQPEHTSR